MKKTEFTAARTGSDTGKPFDVITNVLIEMRPFDWVSALHLTGNRARVLDADLATVTDRVIRVDGAAPYLLHIEFQASQPRQAPAALCTALSGASGRKVPPAGAKHDRASALAGEQS